MHALLLLIAVAGSAPDPRWIAMCRPSAQAVDAPQKLEIEVFGAMDPESGLTPLDAGTVGKPSPALARARKATWYSVDGAQEAAPRTFPDAYVLTAMGEQPTAPEGGADDAMIVLGPCTRPGAVYATVRIHPVPSRALDAKSAAARVAAIPKKGLVNDLGDVGAPAITFDHTESIVLLQGTAITVVRASGSASVQAHWSDTPTTLPVQFAWLEGTRPAMTIPAIEELAAFHLGDDPVRWLLVRCVRTEYKDAEPMEATSRALLIRISPDGSARSTEVQRTIWSD